MTLNEQNGSSFLPGRSGTSTMVHLNFASFVEHNWRQSQFSGPAGFILQRKMHALKLALKKWSKGEYGDVSSRLHLLENELHQLDLKAEIMPLMEDDLKQQREKKIEMWKLSKKLEWEWLQKSRQDWNMKGD